MEDLLGIGKLSSNSMELVKTVYPDLAQPAIKKVGFALETTLDYLTIPVKYLGVIGAKHELNVQKHLKKYQEKLDEHNEDEVGVVPPEIGVPIIEDLTRITNTQLADFYVQLLLNASLIENSKYAHPSFINVLRSMSADEAKIVEYLSKEEQDFVYIQAVRKDEDYSRVPLNIKLNNIDNVVDLYYPDNKDFYAISLIKMGIIEELNTYQTSEIYEYQYEHLQKEFESIKVEFEKEVKELPEDDDLKRSILDYNKGSLRLTPYGKQFLKSVIIEQ